MTYKDTDAIRDDIVESIQTVSKGSAIIHDGYMEDYCRGYIDGLDRAIEIIDNAPSVCGNNPKWCESCVSKGKCASTKPTAELKRIKNELNDELNELNDEKIISFLLPGNPDTSTAQQKGVRIVRGQPQFFEKSTVARAKARLSWLLKQTRPKHPYTGSVELQVEWRFARGSKPKRFIGTFKKTRPDLDNMLKGFMDVMGDLGYFEDDAQVCRIMLSKVWVDDPDAGIYVQICEMDDNVLGGSDDDG